LLYCSLLLLHRLTRWLLALTCLGRDLITACSCLLSLCSLYLRSSTIKWKERSSKGKGAQFNDSIIATKTVGVEASGCEQLAQSRYAATPRPGSNPWPLSLKSDALPLRHHATQRGWVLFCSLYRPTGNSADTVRRWKRNVRWLPRVDTTRYTTRNRAGTPVTTQCYRNSYMTGRSLDQ